MKRLASSPTIIRASLEHASLIAPLFDAYRQFYGQTSDLPAAFQFISARLKTGQSVVFVASVQVGGNTTAVGFVQLYPAFSSLSMKPLWILNDLFVVPEARKRGIAKALMGSARQLAVATGAKKMILATATDNYSVQKLYERLGYKREVDFYSYTLNI